MKPRLLDLFCGAVTITLVAEAILVLACFAFPLWCCWQIVVVHRHNKRASQ